jgi:plastocyanin
MPIWSARDLIKGSIEALQKQMLRSSSEYSMRGLFVMAGLLLGVIPALAGDISGEVIITKHLGRKTVVPGLYNLRGTAPPVTETEKEINELERTVILLEGEKADPAPPRTVQIEQRNSRFEPDLVVIPVGSSVEFPNDDAIFHNVFSLSGAQPFDLGYYPKSQSRIVKFNHAGIIQVYCHIHANMYAAIVVTASPWYGRPSGDGTFAWTNIPSGHYRLVAWHKIAGLYSTTVDVPETGTVHTQIRVPIDVGR